MRPLITLTTDFGTTDHYVGTMKGVIARIAPEAQVTDITHGIAPFDVMSGALAIAATAPYWPEGTVHVIVIDPGVGSERKQIASRVDGQIFVCPDNGLLEFIWRRARNIETRELSDDSLFLKPVSQTFHGRDIFTPVAAHLANGTPFEQLGSVVADPVRIDIPEPERVDDNTVRGHILKADAFGNLITDLGEEWHPKGDFQLSVAHSLIERLLPNYTEAEPGELFAIIGSSGWLEISAKEESAAAITAAEPGDEIVLRMLG